jgi:hypothetical protein
MQKVNSKGQTRITIVIGREIAASAEKAASTEGRSVSSYVRRLLARELAVVDALQGLDPIIPDPGPEAGRQGDV